MTCPCPPAPFVRPARAGDGRLATATSPDACALMGAERRPRLFKDEPPQGCPGRPQEGRGQRVRGRALQPGFQVPEARGAGGPHLGSPRPRPRELEPGCPGRGALGRRPGARAVPGRVGAGCSATNLGAAAASQRPGGSFRWREDSAQAAETGESRPGAGSCSRSRLSEAASGAGRTLPEWGN